MSLLRRNEEYGKKGRRKAQSILLPTPSPHIRLLPASDLTSRAISFSSLLIGHGNGKERKGEEATLSPLCRPSDRVISDSCDSGAGELQREVL